MLHIINGESTLYALAPAGLPGDLHSWGDILMEGPLRAGAPEAQDWPARAGWLEEHFHIPGAEYLAKMQGSLAALAAAPDHDEVVLWFENDLFCQVHLLFLLAHFHRAARRPAQLTLICPRHERLGTLTAGTLAALFDARRQVDGALLSLGAAAWHAYTAPDPLSWQALLQADLTAWPELRDGIVAHLSRFPAPATGLNLLEAEALRILNRDAAGFAGLFHRTTAAPGVSPLGIGDAQFAAYLERLAAGDPPLVSGPRAGFADPQRWMLAITEAGRDVLEARRERMTIFFPEHWLGGVRQGAGEPPWRWDGERLDR